MLGRAAARIGRRADGAPCMQRPLVNFESFFLLIRFGFCFFPFRVLWARPSLSTS
jgi:hypothetical protein